eukprot:COSAG05_NODE_2098_length_3565_cov_1.838430_4_plen_48_part_00
MSCIMPTRLDIMIVASTMDSTKTSAAKILNLATTFSSQYGLLVHIGS